MKIFAITFLCLVTISVSRAIPVDVTDSPQAAIDDIPTAPHLTTPSTPICPPTGVAHFPHGNCQYFFVCINGEPFETRCSVNTLWDDVLNLCRSADLVDCGTRTRP